MQYIYAFTYVAVMTIAVAMIVYQLFYRKKERELVVPIFSACAIDKNQWHNGFYFYDASTNEQKLLCINDLGRYEVIIDSTTLCYSGEVVRLANED